MIKGAFGRMICGVACSILKGSSLMKDHNHPNKDLEHGTYFVLAQNSEKPRSPGLVHNGAHQDA